MYPARSADVRQDIVRQGGEEIVSSTQRFGNARAEPPKNEEEAEVINARTENQFQLKTRGTIPQRARLR